MKLHISNSVSKLGSSIPSINLPPIITCRQNAPCAKKCYAAHGRFCFPHNRELLLNNLLLWKTNPEQFKNEVIIGTQCSRYARWHSAGDIPDATYFQMMVEVAEELPNTEFLAFTKKFEIVNEYLNAHDGVLPKNLNVLFSPWGDGFQPENPYKLPLAYIKLKAEHCTIPDDAYECSGNCAMCAFKPTSCWHLKRGQSVFFNEHR